MISGLGGLTTNGTVTLDLTGNNTFVGGTTVAGGTLQLGSTTAAGSSTNSVTVSSGAILDLHTETITVGALSGAGTITNLGASGTATLTVSNATVSSTFAGTMQDIGTAFVKLAKTGSAALTLTGTNNGVGVTLNSGGYLNINNNYAVPAGSSSTTFTISGGTLGNTSGGLITLANNPGEAWGGNFAFAGPNDLNLGTGNVALSAARTVTLTSNNLTVAGAVSGAFSLTVSGGAGTLILNGANTYSGGTVIDGGLLEFGSTSDIPGTGSITVSGTGGIVGGLVVAGAYNTVTGWLGSSKIVASSSGALAILGTSTETITMTNYSYASLSLGASGAATYSGNLTPSGSIYRLGGGGGTLNFTPAMTSGSLAVVGPGTVILTANDTFSGTTTISGGTLQLGDGQSNNGSLSSNITDSASSMLTFANPNAETYSGIVSGSGSVTKTGTGTLMLTGSNTYTGGTTIASGTLQLGDGLSNNGVIGTATNNATLIFANPNPQTYINAVSGTGNVIMLGPNLFLFDGQNIYTGSTTISSGTLQLGNGTTQPGATLNYSSGIIDNSVLAFGRTTNVTSTAPISGTGSVIVNGASGTLTLNSSDAYSGGTTLSGGTLQIGNAAALGSTSGAATISNGLLDLHGYSIGVGACPARGPSTTVLHPALPR